MEKCSTCIGSGFKQAYRSRKWQIFRDGCLYEINSFYCANCGSTINNRLTVLPRPTGATETLYNKYLTANEAVLANDQSEWPIDGNG